MKKMFMIIMGLAMFLCPMRAGVELPGDMATIEALISLHKMMKSEEDEAMRKIAVSFGEQSVVTKGAKKFNDVRSTLDSKLNNMHSYVIFAASISSTANSLYRLIKEYSEFTNAATSTVLKKPMVGWYYTEAMYACSREIKNIQALYATMTASGINVMKASMDEKMDMLIQLKTSIDNMRGIIGNANVWCSIVAIGGFHHDYIWDILNSEVTDKIAEGVINNWFSV